MKRPEQQLQQDIVRYFAYQYPTLKGLLCSNLNNSKDARTGGINKSLGVIPGRSDLVFYFKGKAYHIEVKALKGKQSEAQKEWEYKMVEQGFDYDVVRSLDEFLHLMKIIIGK